MAELEDSGYIVQPHTSAGRIPTLLGFQHYVEGLETDEKLSVKDENNLDKLDLSGDRENIKVLAKKLAEMSNDAVVVGFSPFDVYHTGLSNLFSQPEFLDNELVHSMSQVIDGLDNIMEQIYQTAGDNSEIVLGDNNPFGDSCSAIVSKMVFDDGEIVVAILGPMRMDYSRNLGLVDYLQKKLNYNKN
jgi:transcriptional regulator of heat shock response